MIMSPPIDLPHSLPPVAAVFDMLNSAQLKEKIAQLTREVEELKLIGMIKDIAREYGVDPDKAVELARRESSLNPKAVNVNKDKSRDRGLYQINSRWHAVSDEQAFDPLFAIHFAMKAISEGKARWWVAGKGIFYDVG